MEMALASLLILQDLRALTVVLRSLSVKHLQASVLLVLVPLKPMALVRQDPAWVLKVVVRLLQRLMKVMLGWGKLAGLQDLLTLISQSNKVLVRLVSCLAPELEYDPPQDRLLLLPPPISISLKAMGANTPFLPDLLPPVLFCLVILL